MENDSKPFHDIPAKGVRAQVQIFSLGDAISDPRTKVYSSSNGCGFAKVGLATSSPVQHKFFVKSEITGLIQYCESLFHDMHIKSKSPGRRGIPHVRDVQWETCSCDPFANMQQRMFKARSGIRYRTVLLPGPTDQRKVPRLYMAFFWPLVYGLIYSPLYGNPFLNRQYHGKYQGYFSCHSYSLYSAVLSACHQPVTFGPQGLRSVRLSLQL